MHLYKHIAFSIIIGSAHVLMHAMKHNATDKFDTQFAQGVPRILGRICRTRNWQLPYTICLDGMAYE